LEAEHAKADPERPEFKLPPTDEDADEGDEEEEKKDEGKDDDDKKKKKKKSKEVDPDPLTGIWVTEVAEGELPAARLQVRLVDGEHVEGLLRSPLVSERLLEVTGHYGEEGALTLEAWGDKGPVRFEGKLDDVTVDAEEVRFEATVDYAGVETELALVRESREYPMAKRKPRYVAPPEDEDEEDDSETKASPRKSKSAEPPKPPREDAKLEPFRRAMAEEAAILVEVTRADEILDCVEAFEDAGIKPVLLEAGDAYRVADEIAGRVAGVLLSDNIVVNGSGTRTRNRYAELQSAGVPVAFRSDAEEGAVDLPLMAAYAVVEGMSPEGALRALTSDAADMLAIGDRVGRLARGLSGDVLLLDKSPLEPASRVLRVWVAGQEVR
jgi:hypothetical protein